MSFYTMAFMGTAPFGSLIAGYVADRIGAPHTLLIGGIGCIIGGALFYTSLPRLRQFVRPIYIQKGILPELSVAASVAAEMSVPPHH
jgi:fucose permease